MSYQDFLEGKMQAAQSVGFNVDTIDARLFDFQRDIVRWALRRGRAAIFANTGLGKTRMQIEWARHVNKRTGKPVLILAPLAVVRQTVAEGAEIDAVVHATQDGTDISDGINATNYDRLHRFDTSKFGGVVLDESSIIKHHDAKTLGLLLGAFAVTPYRLACTATPAPNDWTELGTHAEFLGVCRRAEMLAEYFVHDGGETQVWRLKGHARAAFWRWVASWGALVSHPRDLGYDVAGYDLPPLDVHQHVVTSDVPEGELFAVEASTLQERRAARRESIGRRVAIAAKLATAERQPWVIWCDLNDESTALAAAIPDAVDVTGSMDRDEKERRLVDFGEGKIRVLVTKPSIAGFGLNWQHCARMAFVGVTDSWEAYFQSVRRVWRFGQKQQVQIHVITSEAEGAVVANLKRKDEDAARMSASLARETAAIVRHELVGATKTRNPYNAATRMEIPSWLK